jgi:3-oxoacyl-[acyl-carrier-protein] synthase-3
MTHAAITGWGKCLPPAVLSNQDLSTMLETSGSRAPTRS